MKQGKRNLIATAIPIAAITIGCVAAQDDMDALAQADVEDRASGVYDARWLMLELVEIGPGSVFTSDEAQRAEERAVVHADEMMIAGGLPYQSDVIFSALTREQIAASFGFDTAGAYDPCQITITAGAGAMAEHPVRLRGYHTSAPDDLFVMEQREDEQACSAEGGFFFEPTEAGAHGGISLCPSSCDEFASAAAEGDAIAIEVVIGEA